MTRGKSAQTKADESGSTPENPTVVTAQDLTMVTLYFAKTGPPSAAEPFGLLKLQIPQPRSAIVLWSQAKQAATPGRPNIRIVHDGREISHLRDASIEVDMPALPVGDDEKGLAQLELRRAELDRDIVRLETMVTNLHAAHEKTIKAYVEEEERMREALTKLRDELKASTEFEAEISKNMRARLRAHDGDLSDSLDERAKYLNKADAILAELRSRDGSTALATIDKIADRAEKLTTGPRGSLIAMYIAQKMGMPNELIMAMFFPQMAAGMPGMPGMGAPGAGVPGAGGQGG